MEDLFSLSDEEISGDCKRPFCQRCRRPQRVCWCPWSPESPVEISGKIIVLQHPKEEKRNLKTAPMLEVGLASHCLCKFYGKKFPTVKQQGLAELLAEPETYVLYPGPKSQNLRQLAQNRPAGLPYNIVLIDGTWAQAKSMFYHSPTLHTLPQVSLAEPGPSLYVVRTQAAECCLSTVESAAHAASIMEGKGEIFDQLVKPLRALCTFQLKHGAVEHHDKITLLELGQYTKKVGKRTIKFLKQTVPEAAVRVTKNE